jgi:hypothetical protein
MTSDHLLEAIRSQYPATQGWIVLPQVANATGAGRGRTSDALAMNGWPSRGLELVGFEIKVTRQDWRRELEQPEKADPIYQYCDGWYLVTPDDVVVVRGQELPSTWGHLVAGRQGVKVVKVATKLQPKAMDRSFLAAIIRRLVACETPDAKLTIAREAGRKDGVAEGRKLERARIEHSSTYERVKYQVDSLQSLERIADRTLRAIRNELVGLKDLPTGPAQP